MEKEAKQSEKVIQETFQGTQEHGNRGGWVPGAIGETIVEIAQQTKQLVIGQDHDGTDERGSYKSGSTTYGKKEQ